MIVWGKRMYGKTEVVENTFHVKTQFFHLYFLPLIPLASFVIVAGSEEDDGFNGKEIPMSFKSVLTGWARVWAVFFGVLLPFLGATTWTLSRKTAIMYFVSGALSWVIVRATYSFAKPTVERAMQLARELGMPSELLEPVYGKDALALSATYARNDAELQER